MDLTNRIHDATSGRPRSADPIGRLVWISPPLPGARHDMGAGREHGIIDALTDAEIPAVADTSYQGAGPTVVVPQRRRRLDPDTGRYRRLSRNQRDVNATRARRRGPGERVNAELKNWRILRNIRSCPQPRSRAHRRSSDPHIRQRVIRLAKARWPACWLTEAQTTS
jgi:DDE superfamily endonuclease